MQKSESRTQCGPLHGHVERTVDALSWAHMAGEQLELEEGRPLMMEDKRHLVVEEWGPEEEEQRPE